MPAAAPSRLSRKRRISARSPQCDIGLVASSARADARRGAVGQRSETRLHALGTTLDCRLLHVTFTLRQEGRRLRVISARDMHRKERKIYEAKAKEGP
jgi:uncharacterized DUF497 family protein